MTDDPPMTVKGWADDNATVPGKPSSMTSEPRASLPSYKLGELLGRGGMGEVILAEDLDIGRKVAIKRMRTEAPSDVAVARFLREAKIQARLDHPSIVPVHELGRDSNGLPYFTMKRLSGTTLSEVIRSKRDTQQRMLRAFAEVCLAIEFAHIRGFIHRDLKPSNVMLGDFGEVYVIDWGLARALDEADVDIPAGESLGGETQAGTIMGTPGYMSPEQTRGDTVGPSTDVYALGAILYEILTGRRLHPQGEAAIASTLAGGEMSPTRAAPERAIAPELDALCTAALSELPDRRPSARALADGVQRYLDGDRDLERRRTVAAELLAAARADLASNDPARRGSAMKAAGRALALDPSSEEAAALVGKLMLEPPPVMPPELARRLDDGDRAAAVTQSRRASIAMLAYFMAFPLVVWMGVRDWMPVLVLYGLVIVGIGSSLLIARQRFSPVWAVLSNAVLLIVLSRLTSPFLICAPLATSTTVLFAMFPTLLHRTAFVLGAFLTALIVPIALEAAGVWAKTWDVADGHFIADPTAVSFDGTAARVFLIATTLAIMLVVALFVRSLAVSQRDGRRRLEQQAWHLEHLIPKASG